MLVSAHRAYPVSADDAYAAVLAVDMTAWFSRRYLAFPAIKAVTGLEGEWGSHAGQTRVLHLADGGSALETLVTVERGTEFGYELSEISGPMKLVAAGVTGRFRFEEAGTGVRVTWSWDISPTRPVGLPVLPVLGRLWKGWAGRALADLEPVLVDQG